MTWKPAESGAQPTTYWVRVGDRVESTSDTHLTVSGLRNGQPYEVVVFAATEDGRSEGSDPVTATPANGNEGEVAGLIVAFAPGVEDAVGTQDVPGEAATNVDMQVAAQVSDSSVLVQLDEPVSASEASTIAQQLEADPRVEWAEPDQFLYASADSTTVGAGATDPWNLTGTYGVDAPSDPLAGKGATVAVIDTGITAHPALEGKTVSGFDFVSSPEQLMASRQPNAPPVAFDGDYVDAGRFGDIGRDSNPSDPGDWRDVAPTRSSSWHGTQIAGAISSIVPAARIQPIRALSWRGGLLSDIAASITWASGGTVDGVPANATPAKVINMSFSTEVICPTALQDAIDGARERGSILIAAAGNASDDASKFAPGNCGGVITVGATGSDGSRASYSNHGTRVDVSAPGGTGSSPVPTITNTGIADQSEPGQGSGYGTSIAAAHVSAAAALLAGKNSELAPDDAFAVLTGKNYVKKFAANTCDAAHPEYGCGAGILSLAQIAAACTPSSANYTSGSTTYRVLSFTAVGTCDWTSPAYATSFDWLAVGGGGGGGSVVGGGGGAGRMVRKNGDYASANTTHSITVGAGGAGGVGNGQSSNGGATVFWGWTAPGGGGGATGDNQSAQAGGSGGGGSCWSSSGGAAIAAGGTVAGSPTGGEGVGNAGGAGTVGGGATCVAGGGGGAAAAGAPANPSGSPAQSGGDGGAGLADDITGTSTYYAGGGGGGLNGAPGASSGFYGVGGVGGGGRAGLKAPVNVSDRDGASATGYGSGGGGASNSGSGGNGSSGIVIVRYALSTSSTIEILAGDNQTTAVGTGVSVSPKVLVKGPDGLPLSGASVTFAVASGGGTITGSSQTTAADGTAQLTSWTLGTTAGTNTLTASYNGGSVTFTATGTPGSTTQLLVVTAPVAGASGALLATQPVLRWADTYGNTTTYGGAVAAVIPTAGSTGTLSGTTNVWASGGTVTFTNLRLTGVVGTTYTLRFEGSVGSWPTRTVSLTGPGSATAAQSTVAASSASVTANGTTTSTITATAKDASGNVVPSQSVFFEVSSGTATLSSGPWTTNSSGVATATISSTTVGAVVVSAYLGTSSSGTLITQTASVNFVAGPATAAQSTLAASPSTVAADGTTSSTITATAKDANGNVVASQSIFFSIYSGTGTLSSGPWTTNSSGVATATLTSTTAGSVTVRAYLGTSTSGTLVTQTTSVTFTAGAATAAQSTVAASPASVAADGSTASTVTVTAKDANSNAVASQSVFFQISSGTGTLSSGPWTTNASGVATATVTSTTAGSVTVRAYLGTSSSGTLITQTAGITFTPGTATKFAITGTGSQTAGGTQSLTITALDANGNTATSYTGDKSLTFSGATTSSGGYAPSVKDKTGAAVLFGTATTITFTNGVATVSSGANGVMALYAAETATIVATAGAVTTTGSDRLSVAVAVGALSAFEVTDTSGAVLSTQTAGTSFAIKLRAADAYGNTVTSFTGTTTITSTSTISAGSGATAAFTAGVLASHSITLTTAGASQTITATRTTGGAEAGTSAAFTINPGAASTSTSVVSVSSSSITANGASTSTITVTLKDAYSNSLTASGGTVAISTTLGSVGSTTNNSNGTYTATLTSATTVGTATISATLGGNALTSTTTVTFAPGAATKVLITTQPVAGLSGALLSTQPVVRIADAQGNTVTSSSASVEVTSSGGTLGGTATVNAVSGVVTFTSLTLAGLTTGTYTLNFASSGLTSITSSSITPTGAGSAYSLELNAGNNQSAMMGSATAIAPSVIVRDSGLNPVQGVSVTFASAASGASTELLGPATGTASGSDISTSQGVRAFKFTAASAACLTSASSIMDSANASAYTVNIYADNGGTVGTLLGTLAQTSSGSSTVTYSGSIAVTSGTTYWAGVQGSTPTYLSNIRLAPGQPSTSWTWSTAASNRAWSSDGGSTWNLTTFADHPQIGLTGVAGGCSSSSSVTTNSSGIATSPTWTLSTTIGANTMTATSGSLVGSPVTFTATGTARPITITADDKSVTYGSSYSASYTLSQNALGGSDAISGVTYTYTGTGSTSYGPSTTAPTGGGTYSITPSAAVFSTGSASNYTITYTAGTISIGQQSQTITFAQPADVNYGAAAYSLAPTASSGLTVTLTSNSTGVCTVSGAVVTIVSAGTCSLTASQAGNANYSAAASVTNTFAVNKINQSTLTMTSASTAIYGQTIAMTASGGSGTGTLSFGVVTGTCTISGSTLTLGDAGSACTVRASKLGDNNYNDITSANQTITISRAGQTVAFTSSVPASPLPNGTYTPTGTSTSTVTNSASGLSPVFTIPVSSSAKCSISGGVVTFLATGSCVIEANSAQTTNFTAATTASQTIVIGSLNQNITFAQPANVAFGTSSVSMGATASSNLTVTYTRGSGTTNSACTVSTLGVVTILAVGTCEVTADQAGDSQYAAASPVTRAFSVVAAVASAPTLTSASASDQSITVGFTAPGFTGGVSITAYRIVATPVTTGTTVTSTACTSSPCTITGLVNGTSYTVTVAAINSAGTGAASAASTALTPATAAFAVSGFSAAPGNTTVALAWTPLTNAQLGGGTFTYYKVSKRVAGTSSWTLVTNSLTTQSTGSYTVTGLDNGTSYDFQIVAVTSANASEIPGNTAEVVQYPSTTPSAPRSVTTLASTATDIQVSWQVPLSDGGSVLLSPYYTVSITSTSPGATTPVTCTFASATDRFCSASNLTSGKAYSISVSAINRMGTGAAGTATYNVPSSDATLSNLVLTGSGGAVALTPAFASSTFVYEAEVPFSSSTITLTPTTSVAGAVVDIDGSIVASGSASQPIPLTVGTNDITILVTASDPRYDETYELTVTRLPAPPSGGGSWAPTPNLPLTPPAAVLNGSVPGAVLQGGQTRSEMTMTRLPSGAGWKVAAPDFSMSVETVDSYGRPVKMGSNGAMQGPQGGRIVIVGSGYLPSSDVAAFAIPRNGTRSGSLLHARVDVQSIYLGSAAVNANGRVAASFVVPNSLALGDYVFQLNGLSEQSQVRSVNLLLNVIPPTNTDASSVRMVKKSLQYKAFYGVRSDRFTPQGVKKMHNIVASVPKNARNVKVKITGASVGLGSVSENVVLAGKRAERISDYLVAKGIQGDYEVTFTTSFKVGGDRAGATDKVDKPLTSVSISYDLPVATT